nr:hypothetical protein [Desulfobacula sp.]
MRLFYLLYFYFIRVASSSRLWQPVFLKMEVRWALTVRMEMNIFSPISLFDKPLTSHLAVYI